MFPALISFVRESIQYKWYQEGLVVMKQNEIVRQYFVPIRQTPGTKSQVLEGIIKADSLVFIPNPKQIISLKLKMQINFV
jgi:hypothetical protein